MNRPQFLPIKEYIKSYIDFSSNSSNNDKWDLGDQWCAIYFITTHFNDVNSAKKEFKVERKNATHSLYKRFIKFGSNINNTHWKDYIEYIETTLEENIHLYDTFLNFYNLDDDFIFNNGSKKVNWENKEVKVDKNQLLKQHNEKFYYNDVTSSYVFFLKSLKGVYTIHENDLKSIKSRYSNWDGEPSTLNQIARDFSLPRGALVEIKTQMGWTHDSDPFLDSELLENDVDTLTEEVLQSKRRAVYEAFQKKEWDEVKRDAQKYRSLEHEVIKPLMEKMNSVLPSYQRQKPSLNYTKSKEKQCLIVPLMDIHVGKLPFYMNGTYSYAQFHDECMNTFKKLLERSLSNGTPDEIVSIAGSDWFHVDNIKHSTSELTSQAGQINGNYYEMVLRGYNLAFEMFDHLVDLGFPIKVYEVDGNHDRMLSLNLSLALQQRYRKEKTFSIDITPDNRKYHVYGSNLFSFLHGDFLNRNPTKRQNTILGNILNDTRRIGISTLEVDNFVVFSGHVHKQSSSFDEDKGILDIVVPSLSVTDMWHHEHSYEGNRRCVSTYTFSKDGKDSQIITIGV